ncbi:antibiotic biosynthesis monooxygenase [Geomonas subterranea]|uniref:Antibiotic biosynthesis monooxygenase n=1 Tax=Geomonas subterranea TaxID=2847989 RepID=A0ABX8LJZ6_9BACT|nr:MULTISPECIES: antibiotic biosynthesis monooxygenase [Geomonas]QXE92053.1 antibiotic biosynthesis monooxygenase [Geomonas subterranea]QXM09854.1 antibiotic biosynthesis monooxygenase [Geomonas subterranea]
MGKEENSLQNVQQGATVVITHRVKDGQQEGYNDWLEEIGPLCRASLGHLDWHIVRPIAGLSETYTIMIRFDTVEHLQGWMNSEERRRLIEKVRPLLAGDDDFFVRSGLDFWFTPLGAKARVPVRWKQFLVTWSAIFPLASCVPLVVVPLLRWIGVPSLSYLDALLVSGVIVFLMVYLVMPRYTRLVQRWLFD